MGCGDGGRCAAPPVGAGRRYSGTLRTLHSVLGASRALAEALQN